MKYYDSMGVFESEHGIWVRRVDAEARIHELEAVIREAYEETCESCPDCNGCGNAHDILGRALDRKGGP